MSMEYLGWCGHGAPDSRVKTEPGRVRKKRVKKKRVKKKRVRKKRVRKKRVRKKRVRKKRVRQKRVRKKHMWRVRIESLVRPKARQLPAQDHRCLATC